MSNDFLFHPEGEDRFTFDTYMGQVSLEASEESMTPFGGSVPLAAFLKKLGVVEALAQTCPVKRTSPNASSVFDILTTFVLGTLCDCDRFRQLNRLRADPILANVFGAQKMVGDDAVRRLFQSVPAKEGAQWVANASRGLWEALPDSFVLDWDSTVLTRYGNQEGSQVGYNPTKPGRKSHHPLLAVVAGTRLCPYYRWRPGNAGAAAQWIEAMEEAQNWLGKSPWLNRGDIGFCSEEVLQWHEQQSHRPRFLFKMRQTANLKRAISRLDEEEWRGCPTPGVLQTSEIELQLSGWSQPRRVVIGRRLQGYSGGAENGEFWKFARHEYEAYVTSLTLQEATSWQVIELYRKRADCENVFDELKNQWGFAGFCSKHKQVTELSARLLLVAYNMWNLFLRLLEPNRHVEAKYGRRWFLQLPAKLVTSGRQRTWKIALNREWMSTLMAGYQRVFQWLQLTAPQLKEVRVNSPPQSAEMVRI